MIKFILYKNNLITKTKDIKIVKEMRKLGWKVKESNLGELL